MNSTHTKTLALLFVLLAFRPATAMAQAMKARVVGESIQLEAQDFQFLSAESQRRLRDGVTVTYAFRVNVSATRSGDPMLVLNYHCAFSFDIFEEKYKVVRVEPGYRSASHLSESAARDLCIHSLEVP